MKKLVSMILCFIMVISLCSCGKEKKAAQEVYDNVGEAYELLERFSSDIYSAWRTGIYEDDVDIKTLSEELYLSEEELQEGLFVSMADYFYSTKEEIRDMGNYDKLEVAYFEKVYTSQFSACVNLVVESYKDKGTVEEIQNCLDVAKEQLRLLSEKHSDYEHYEDLKTYYTTTNTYFKFCQDLSCSFEQLQTTCEGYEKEIRDCKGKLEFAFE